MIYTQNKFEYILSHYKNVKKGLTLPATPQAELHIDIQLVTMLLADQYPDFLQMTVYGRNEGWDNVIFRLGNYHSIRLPRREMAAALILNEQLWLPQLADQLLLPIPVPYYGGHPAHGYPWHWSILPWLKGRPANMEAVHASQAQVLASFLRSLHTNAPTNAPKNKLRGVRLQQRADAVEERMHKLMHQTMIITPQLWQLWHMALQAQIDVAPTWLHGDLHPGNILVEAGSITAVIDWGDICSGDCATDLAALWMLFSERSVREQALAAYGNLSEATLQRAQGWALLFGVMLLESGMIDNPTNAMIGTQILHNLCQ